MEILLAEDNEDNYLVIKSNLKKIEGINLKWLKDGLQAKKELEDGYKPDIFLLDIQMPNMDGIELSRWIRNQNDFKSSCIIATTASVFPEMKEEYKKSGIDYILEKPFSRKDFLETIEKCKNKGN